jgi:peptidyl-prolyl cis-trans isomerase D
MFRQVNQAMQAKAEALAERVRKGETLQAVAAASGTKIVQAPGVDRQSGQQNPLVSGEILAAAFGGKPGQVFVARGRTFGYAVGKVDANHTGDAVQLAQATEQARAQMTSTVFRELGESAQVAARHKMKVKVNYDLARQVIGLPALNAPTKAPPK